MDLLGQRRSVHLLATMCLSTQDLASPGLASLHEPTPGRLFLFRPSRTERDAVRCFPAAYVQQTSGRKQSSAYVLPVDVCVQYVFTSMALAR